jgi:hypothetical protein
MAAARLGLGHRIDALAQGRQRGPGIALEGLAVAGQEDAAPRALEQCHAEDVLQLGDGLGDRRLGDGQGLRRTAEAAPGRDLQEAGQVADLDATVGRHVSYPFGYE